VWQVLVFRPHITKWLLQFLMLENKKGGWHSYYLTPPLYTSFCIAHPKPGKNEGCDGLDEPTIKQPIFMEMKPSQKNHHLCFLQATLVLVCKGKFLRANQWFLPGLTKSQHCIGWWNISCLFGLTPCWKSNCVKKNLWASLQ
jgi:hypothetical protein